MLRSIRLILLVGALALAAAGCGESDDASGASDPATSQSQEDNAQDTARAKLEQCLRDNGAERPQGGGQLSEAERDEFMEAIQGPCAEFRDDAIGDISPEEQQELQDARVKFQDCMRDEGIEIDGTPQSGGGMTQLDPNDPDVAAALEKCQELVPEVGSRLGAPGGGG